MRIITIIGQTGIILSQGLIECIQFKMYNTNNIMCIKAEKSAYWDQFHMLLSQHANIIPSTISAALGEGSSLYVWWLCWDHGLCARRVSRYTLGMRKSGLYWDAFPMHASVLSISARSPHAKCLQHNHNLYVEPVTIVKSLLYCAYVKRANININWSWLFLNQLSLVFLL